MRTFLRLFFAFALLIVATSYARAEDFHVTVLDPNVCQSNPSVCTIVDTTASFSATLTASTCVFAGVSGLPSDPATYGCLVLLNQTETNITSLDLTFGGLGSLTFECDTAVPGSIFASASCGSSGGVDDFFFFNGLIAPRHEAVIYETGVDPDLFHGTGTVNTPEPAPFLLLMTGMMFAGLYLTKQRRLFARARN